MASIDLVPGLFFGMFVLLWVSALISWCFGAYYMWKLMHAWRPGRSWGKFLFFSPAFPSFFTDEGNIYRVRMLRWLGLFILFVALVFGLGAIAESTGLAFTAALNRVILARDGMRRTK